MSTPGPNTQTVTLQTGETFESEEHAFSVTVHTINSERDGVIFEIARDLHGRKYMHSTSPNTEKPFLTTVNYRLFFAAKSDSTATLRLHTAMRLRDVMQEQE